MAKKKSKSSRKKKDTNAPKRVLEFKEDMQEYVLMTKMLGDRRINVTLVDGSEKMAIIPGRFRKRCWMKPGDVLLASHREFQGDKLDIIHKYEYDEAKKLVGMGEIPSFFLDAIGSGPSKDHDDESGIVFEAEDNDAFNFDDI